MTVLQNAIVLWNARALDKALETARNDDIEIRKRDLEHILPTMIDHINFVGRFDLYLRRRPPFKFVTVPTWQ